MSRDTHEDQHSFCCRLLILTAATIRAARGICWTQEQIMKLRSSLQYRLFHVNTLSSCCLLYQFDSVSADGTAVRNRNSVSSSSTQNIKCLCVLRYSTYLSRRTSSLCCSSMSDVKGHGVINSGITTLNQACPRVVRRSRGGRVLA